MYSCINTIIHIISSYVSIKKSNKKRSNSSSNSKRSVKPCNKFDIAQISYLTISIYVIASWVGILLYSTNFIYIWLNDNICSIYMRSRIIFLLLGRTSVHLFVAVRTRLSKSPRNQSNLKYYKIGLSLLIFDIALIIYGIVFSDIDAVYDSSLQRCDTFASSSIFII